MGTNPIPHHPRHRESARQSQRPIETPAVTPIAEPITELLSAPSTAPTIIPVTPGRTIFGPPWLGWLVAVVTILFDLAWHLL